MPEKRKADESSNEFANMLYRIPLIGMGTSAILNYAPMLKPSLTGRMALYHGTVGENIGGIAREGVSEAYAGKVKRINSILMDNALFEFVANKHPEFLKDERARNEFLDILSNPELEKGHYANNKIKATQEFLKKRYGSHVGFDEIDRLVRKRGKRVYYGYHPAAVADWASKATEAEIAERRFDGLMGSRGKAFSRYKQEAELYANAFTGGLLQDVEDIKENIQYRSNRKKAPIKKMSLKEIQELAGRGHFSGKGVIVEGIGGKNLKSVGVFKDFPGIEPVMAYISGMKKLVAKVLPNYSPGRDISTEVGIRPEHIKAFHLIDERGKPIEIIENLDFKKPERLNIKWRLAKAAKPLAVLYGGAELIHYGLTGKTIAKTLYDRYKNRNKTAALKLSPFVRSALKYSLISGGIAGGAALAVTPIQYLTHKYENEGRKISPVGYAVSEALVAPVLGMGATAYDTGKGIVNFIGGDLEGAAMHIGGSYGGSMATQVSTGLHEETAKKILSDENKRERALKSGKDYFLRVGLPSAAGAGLMIGYPAYKIYRHYPVSLYNVIRGIKENMRDDIKDYKKYFGTIGKPAARGLIFTAAALPLSAYLAYRLVKAKKDVMERWGKQLQIDKIIEKEKSDGDS